MKKYDCKKLLHKCIDYNRVLKGILYHNKIFSSAKLTRGKPVKCRRFYSYGTRYWCSPRHMVLMIMRDHELNLKELM